MKSCLVGCLTVVLLMTTLLSASAAGVEKEEDSSGSAKKEHSSHEVEILLFTIFALVAILLSIAATSIEWIHRFFHESLVVLALGVGLGSFQLLLGHNKMLEWFDELFSPANFETIFYQILLPPIIFNAGFTLKQRNFISNLGSVLTFAFGGTIIAALIIGLMVSYVSPFLPGFKDGSKIDLVESMLFGALSSCTDTVATIAVLLELNITPVLYSLAFGESVLNDAVSIVLVHTLTPYVGVQPTVSMIGGIVADFLICVLGSLAIGVAVGLTAAFVTARQHDWHLGLSTTFEMIQILLFAELSYIAASAAGFSGVISIFICALIMSHYCWHSISLDSRRAVFQTASLLDYLAQTLVFLSLGFLLFAPSNFRAEFWDPAFIALTIGSMLIARVIAVVPLSLMLNIGRKVKITWRYMAVMCWCSMRGIVSLLLALGLTSPHRPLLINTTFVVIFFTNIVIGPLTRPVVLSLHVKSSEEHANVLDPINPRHSLINIKAFIPAKRNFFARLWWTIDNLWIKRLFGGKARLGDMASMSFMEVLNNVPPERTMTDEVADDTTFQAASDTPSPPPAQTVPESHKSVDSETSALLRKKQQDRRMNRHKTLTSIDRAHSFARFNFDQETIAALRSPLAASTSSMTPVAEDANAAILTNHEDHQ